MPSTNRAVVSCGERAFIVVSDAACAGLRSDARKATAWCRFVFDELRRFLRLPWICSELGNSENLVEYNKKIVILCTQHIKDIAPSWLINQPLRYVTLLVL